MEEWRQVAGNRKYEVSSEGRVRSVDGTTLYTGKYTGRKRTRKGRMLKLVDGGKGYLVVNLSLDAGKRLNFSVHRLVAEAFLAPDPERICVDHIDGNKQNNKISNLRWCTRAENTSWARQKITIRCKRGHSFGPDGDVRINPDGRKTCRICERMHKEKSYAKVKEKRRKKREEKFLAREKERADAQTSSQANRVS